MGPYCKYCGRRCFLVRVLQDGRAILLATCDRGMEHDRSSYGETHETALNPITQELEVARLVTRLRGTLQRADGGPPELICGGRSDGQPVGLTYCLHKVDHPAHDVPAGEQDAGPGVEFVIQSDYGYGQGWEDTVVEATREAGRDQLATYRENQPQYRHRLIRRWEEGSAADAALMDALDRGSNVFGPLAPDLRARLYAAVVEPTRQTWEDAHGIILNAAGGLGGMTLWQALIRHTSYDVMRGPAQGTDEDWARLPTRHELLRAIHAAVRPEEATETA